MAVLLLASIALASSLSGFVVVAQPCAREDDACIADLEDDPDTALLQLQLRDCGRGEGPGVGCFGHRRRHSPTKPTPAPTPLPTPTPPPEASVFVTSHSHDGDFSDLEGGPSGFCNTAAAGAHLLGDWCAVLANDTVSIEDACALQYPLVMVGGEEVAEDIFLNKAVVNRDEFGNEVNIDENGHEKTLDFWSGTNGRNCDNWSKGSPTKGETGRVNSNGKIKFPLTGNGKKSFCDEELPVVCVRVPTPEAPGLVARDSHAGDFSDLAGGA